MTKDRAGRGNSISVEISHILQVSGENSWARIKIYIVYQGLCFCNCVSYQYCDVLKRIDNHVTPQDLLGSCRMLTNHLFATVKDLFIQDD